MELNYCLIFSGQFFLLCFKATSYVEEAEFQNFFLNLPLWSSKYYVVNFFSFLTLSFKLNSGLPYAIVTKKSNHFEVFFFLSDTLFKAIRNQTHNIESFHSFHVHTWFSK